MTDLLPCSQCRRMPWLSEKRGMFSCNCPCAADIWFRSEEIARRSWNNNFGAPLTLAERPQDVPACEERVIGGLRFRADPSMPPGVMSIADEDEPAVGDGVRVVPAAASCVERGRSCEDVLARWSVGACSGGVR